MNITWKIGGEAGFGIMTTGVMFSRLATRHGYHIFDYVEYPSLIRGGHNVYEVAISDTEVFSQEKQVDLLFALNQETIDLHKNEMKDGGLIAYDNEISKVNPADFTGKNVILYPVPFTRLTKEAGALKVMENNVVLGATAAFLGMDLEIVNQLIADTFKEKGDKVILPNQQVAKVGYDYVGKNPPNGFDRKLDSRFRGNDKESGNIKGNGDDTIDKKLVITGNEAVVLGAIAAGCKFYCAYPMTPTSNALHAMAEWGPKYGVVVKHAEDEISVINMAIGASFAGVRSMVGTAGGGFSLMVEGLGLAGMTETPLVILEGMRPGPATGLPTWTSQGDLKFLINASQDEFLRIILAPGDMKEAFYLTAEAFNLAEIYQTPVFVLIDKYLAESHQSTAWFDLQKININRGKLLSWDFSDQDYLRYKITDDGVSPRAVPGMKKTIFTANSYAHNEYGWSTEDSHERTTQVDKRNRKLNNYIKHIPQQKIYGDNDADLTIIAWGSTKGPVLEAMKKLKAEKSVKKINFIHLTHLWPLPVTQISSALSQAKQILLIEGNSQAQMGSLIREQTGIEIKNKFLKYDGRPFYPEDIQERIKEITQ